MDEDEKRIARSLIRLDDKRKRGKLKRRTTSFDRKAGEAIRKAEQGLEISGASEEVRAEIISKVRINIIYNTPYESIGETYCSRSTFYGYVRKYLYHTACNMGIFHEKPKRGSKG